MSDTTLANGETERNKREVFDYVLYVRGVFGRNRKEKRETFRIYRAPDTLVNLDKILADAMAKCAEIKLKAGATIAIDRNPVTLTDYVNGDHVVTLESFLLYSGERLFRATWDGKTATAI